MVVSDPPTTPSNPMPLPSEPSIPSMDTIQRNLGFPGHSVILMILPTLDDKELFNKETNNKTQTSTESPEHEHYSSEQQFVNIYDNNIKTNAVKVGTKHLNAKGWKPGMRCLSSKF